MRRPVVLMYHGVDRRSPAADPDNLFVPPDAFAVQLRVLLRAGWQPVTLDEFLAGRTPRRGFLVTFDDGYVSVGRVAVPVLAELGVPAVCFVCPGRLGRRSDWVGGTNEALLDADGVRALHGAGVEIGAHGWDHTAMAGLPPDALVRHTELAARELAEVIGRRPRAFAYPYGTHDEESRAAVARAGYAVGFGTYRGAGPMAVPRVDVNALDTSRSLRMKTWRAYPGVRSALGRTPALRAAVHSLVGRASRGDDEP